MSGKIVYSLRNCVLHQGTPNIESEKIEESRCKVDEFILLVTTPTFGLNSFIDCPPVVDEEKRTLEINLVNLCCKICSAAQYYYENHKDKFGFIKYDLQDEGVDLDSIIDDEFFKSVFPE